jgi:prevent-host-death family protein
VKGTKKPSVEETTPVLKFGELRAHLADKLNKAEYCGCRVVIERRGRKSAALIPMRDLRALEAFEQLRDKKQPAELEVIGP